MQPKRRLSDFFPLKFKNGNQVKQFSKPCVKCGTMLGANHMHGIARLVEDHIAIAADAQCTKCGENFAVACVINPDKQVKRVVLPCFLFSLYLRYLPPQHGESAPQAMLNHPHATAPEVRDAREDAAEIAKTPSRAAHWEPAELVRGDEVIGRFQEKAIPAWLDLDGKRFEFDRIAPDANAREGEYLLDGCLIYRPSL